MIKNLIRGFLFALVATFGFIGVVELIDLTETKTKQMKPGNEGDDDDDVVLDTEDGVLFLSLEHFDK